MELSPAMSELFWKIIGFFTDLPTKEQYELYITVAGSTWIVIMAARYIKKKFRYKKCSKTYSKAIYRKRSQREWRKIVTRKKFRADGSYYDEQLGKWVGQGDYKQIDE